MDQTQFLSYLRALQKPFKKIVRLEFLQPDQRGIAFTLGSLGDFPGSAAFIQDGALSVSFQNGARRKADISLVNDGNRFAYEVNRLWFGNTVRLQMGLESEDGTECLFQHGIFYFDNPQLVLAPNQRLMQYELSDKWCALDGSHGGNFDTVYEIAPGGNIFSAAASLLSLDKFDFSAATDPTRMIDPIVPVFTDYYNGKTYTLPGGGTASMTSVPYTMRTGTDSGCIADLLIELTSSVSGIAGYDAAGAFRIEPSQDDISDKSKAVLYEFTPQNSVYSRYAETANADEVYNDVIVIGEGLDGYEVWGRAENTDPGSDTCIQRIGRKTYRVSQSNYWNADQCKDLAKYYLKNKSVLQKSITITCGQMFHLAENGLISVQRDDKEGAPIERHRINSFTLPIGEQGQMTINATSLNDYPENITVSGS